MSFTLLGQVIRCTIWYKISRQNILEQLILKENTKQTTHNPDDLIYVLWYFTILIFIIFHPRFTFNNNRLLLQTSDFIIILCREWQDFLVTQNRIIRPNEWLFGRRLRPSCVELASIYLQQKMQKMHETTVLVEKQFYF